MPFVAQSLLWLALGVFAPAVSPQSPDDATAKLQAVHAEGAKLLSEDQIVAIAELQPGSQVAKKDLQSAADRLVQTGLFAKVSYNFQTKNDALTITFHIQEAPRVPAYFDNFPWFADSELTDAIRKKLPFFDGTLPEGGAAVDLAGSAVSELLASHGLHPELQHTVIANPVGEGNVQEFHIEGATMQIASLQFSDSALSSSKVVRQHLEEVVGKPYSRTVIDTFLAEQIRPIYLERGYLRVKLGPAEIRLTGNPNQKLPEQIPVFVPVAQGILYHWKGAQWSGNSLVSAFTLDSLLGLKSGGIADGMQLEGGWDRVREEYGKRGYLEIKIDATPAFDDQAQSVSYNVKIEEGTQFRFGKMVITGISPAGERKLLSTWPIASGDVFDKEKYEQVLAKLQTHPGQIFGDLPIHYETVGHWLQTDAASKSVDVLLDFK
jgi:outer membrane protein assembly factor BamA